MSDARVSHLLHSALAFKETSVNATTFPTKLADVAQALSHARDALLYEACQTLQSPIDDVPEDPLFHTVDMDSDTPGIISTTKPRVEAHHADAADLRSASRRPEIPRPAAPRISRPASEVVGDHAKAALYEALRQNEEVAARDERRERQAMARQQKRDRETEEEREGRLSKQREMRKARKQQKQEQGERGSGREGDDEDRAADPPPRAEAPTLDVDDIEAALCHAAHAVLPLRRARVKDSARLYANPVPCERHMHAIDRVVAEQTSVPSPLQLTLLAGVPHDGGKLIVLQGPPGTGKTEALVNEICQLPFTRALVCAHSNVAVANLYQRLIARVADDVSICVPPARLPGGVVVCSDDPRRRIVCATVSARAGPYLDGVPFDAIFVDEAALLNEALTWTLVRSDVHTLCLAGDVKQLRCRAVDAEALRCAHDRSLMERIVTSSDHPVTTLHVQRRMRASICAFPSAQFYAGELATHESREDVPGVAHVECVRVPNGTCEPIGTSMCNPDEVRAVADLVRDALSSGGVASDRVVVICPYKAQCRAVLAKKLGVEVHTVDSFQGREADVVVLSIVRTGAECGFWTEARRLLVALTRARERLVVVGSWDWTCEPLASLASDAHARGLFRDPPPKKRGGEGGQKDRKATSP